MLLPVVCRDFPLARAHSALFRRLLRTKTSEKNTTPSRGGRIPPPLHFFLQASLHFDAVRTIPIILSASSHVGKSQFSVEGDRRRICRLRHKMDEGASEIAPEFERSEQKRGGYSPTPVFFVNDKIQKMQSAELRSQDCVPRKIVREPRSQIEDAQSRIREFSLDDAGSPTHGRKKLLENANIARISRGA